MKPPVGAQPILGHPLTKGLVGAWLFNEGSGLKAFDLSGKGNHGNFGAGAAVPTWVPGRTGPALDFDGTDDHVDCGNDASMSPLSALSVAMWINTSDFGSTRHIISNDRAGNTMGWFLYTGAPAAGGNVEMVFSGLDYKRAHGTIISGEWNYVVGVYNGANVIIYINGIANVGDAITGNILYNTKLVHIGKRSDIADNYFKGTIDDVKIYNRALSASEIWQSHINPYCWLAQPMDAELMYAAPPVGAIMNQFQRANLGADLYDGVLIT